MIKVFTCYPHFDIVIHVLSHWQETSGGGLFSGIMSAVPLATYLPHVRLH